MAEKILCMCSFGTPSFKQVLLNFVPRVGDRLQIPVPNAEHLSEYGKTDWLVKSVYIPLDPADKPVEYEAWATVIVLEEVERLPGDLPQIERAVDG